jgi:dimethylamine/trimethylamine dehydrogenase
MAQRLPRTGPVVIFDDDHYYMGGVLAERCRAAGLPVTLITSAATVSAWTVNTMEALPIARRLLRLGVDMMPYTGIRGFRSGVATLVNELSGKVFELEAASIVSVTARLPVDGLYADLAGTHRRLPCSGYHSSCGVFRPQAGAGAGRNAGGRAAA